MVLFSRSRYCVTLICYFVSHLCGSACSETDDAGYKDYIRRVAKARRSYETNLHLAQKNEVLDYNPPKMKYAAEETDDHWVNKFNNRYAFASGLYADIRNPKPIVDTANEVELAATSKSLPTNQILVDWYEGFSNFLNQFIEKPFQLASDAWSRGVKSLDSFGAKFLNLNT